jgi:predicted transcriptional regulator
MTIVLTENKSKRRDQLVIMAEIVDISKKGTTKTDIMFKANLSFSQLNQYLTLLTQANFLEKFLINRKEIFKATPKGYEFMERQYQVINFINANRRNSVKTSFDNIFQRSKVCSPADISYFSKY